MFKDWDRVNFIIDSVKAVTLKDGETAHVMDLTIDSGNRAGDPMEMWIPRWGKSNDAWIAAMGELRDDSLVGQSFEATVTPENDKGKRYFVKFKKLASPAKREPKPEAPIEVKIAAEKPQVKVDPADIPF